MKNLLLNNKTLLCLLLALNHNYAIASQITGSLTNFDVINDTGSETHGFEIEIHGVSSSDITRTFATPYIRYNSPSIIDFVGGVKIRYESEWDQFTKTFLQATPTFSSNLAPTSHSCWSGGLGSGYGSSGCEHFGVSLKAQPTATKYSWLTGNPDDGSLANNGGISLPAPIWGINPGDAGEPEVVRAEIEIPNPEGNPYGDAYWVKIFKTETEGAIDLNDLLLENDQVAQAEVEIEWELLQKKPDRQLVLNKSALGENGQAVIRRYEFYKYNTEWGKVNTYDDNGKETTYVDLINGEVTACVFDGCNTPTEDELGSFIGRQIAGVNLQPVPLPPAVLLFTSALGMMISLRRKLG